MMTGRAIELGEVDRLCRLCQTPRLLPLFGLSRKPARKVKNTGRSRFIDQAVPMGRLAFEVSVVFEGESRMAGRNQVVIDDMRLPEFVARSHVTLHAGRRSLIQAFFGVHETGRVAGKSRAVMRMQPLSRRAVTRLAGNAERVFIGRSPGTVRTRRG